MIGVDVQRILEGDLEKWEKTIGSSAVSNSQMYPTGIEKKVDREVRGQQVQRGRGGEVKEKQIIAAG